MGEVLNSVRVLTIIFWGIAIMVGVMSPGAVGKKLGWMVLLMVLAPFIASFAAHLWDVLPAAKRTGVVLVGVPVLLGWAMTRSRFGREVAANAAGEAVYGLLRSRVGKGVVLLMLLGLGLLVL